MAGPDERDSPHGGDGPNEAQIRTFLIADVRGYTLFTQERGDEAAAKLAAKFADIAREEVEARGGTLLELRGDEALCVFSSTREAIRAAVDLQERFVEETTSQPELPLTVGIGLDAGEAVPVQGGYRGGALNLAARLCGQARAGEILASREVTHLARTVTGVRYEDRGALSLEGLSDPVSVVRVVSENLDAVERLRPFAPPPPPTSRRTSRRWVLVLAIVAVLALVAVSIPLLGSSDEPVQVGTNSVARMSAEDGTVELATELGQRLGASAIGFGSLWVAEPDRGIVVRLDLEDGSVTDTIRVGVAPSGIAVGAGSVWVTNAADGTVSRISPEVNEPTDLLRAGTTPTGIAFGDNALWVADATGAQLLRLDPVSGITDAVPLAGQPSGVTFTREGVWVSVAPDSVVRVDPTEPTVTLMKPVGNGPTAIHAAFGSIWVANSLDGTVARLDPSTGGVQSALGVGDGPVALAAAGSLLWVANEFDGSVTAIDPGSNTIDRIVPVGEGATSLATGADGLWLSVGASASAHRGGTLTLSSSRTAFPTLDPAIVYDGDGWAILTITNDGLLAYKRIGGPDGATLVPDLASSLPDVSADGLTYRFPLRQGIRYSTGDPVRPEDFRRAIERALVLSPAAYLYRGIQGADACTRKDPEACDLSDSIVVEDESVTFHLATPDAEFPFKIALPFAFPVPADTPAEDQGLQPLPATGPYMVATTNSEGIELVRNPEFHEWSGAAQPDGFVDAISWRLGEDGSGAYDRLSAGDLDVMMDAPPPEDLAILQSAHPDQVVVWPGAFTLFVGTDVQQAPFDDVRVRQALNFAIDRDHIVDLLGGSTIQRPTCQILPPNFQAYSPFCPHTLDPESNVWSAPDVDRARALIREAGVVGTQVTVSVTDAGTEFLPVGAVETMRYITEVLNDLGLRAELAIEHDGQAYFDALYPPAKAGSPSHPDVFMSGWVSDYPGPRNFIDPQFACGKRGFGNPFGWCDPDLDAAMDDAFALLQTDPAAANQAWMDIEHGLVQDAAMVPLTNPVTTHAVSDRVGNVQVNPQWGILLSRLWVQ